MGFSSLQEMVDLSKKEKKEMWRIILEDQMKEQNAEEEKVFGIMRTMYESMIYADSQYDPQLKSFSGMAGGDGEKLMKLRLSGKSLCGEFLEKVMETAVKMGESNACMRRIVAAPTAGSCGVIPAIFITYGQQKDVEEEAIVKALFISAGIGEVLAVNASISGAEGGCQAEIGSASAMAAGGVAYLEGGDAECITTAVAFAIKNMLGLTCDPVAGLVEVPCIKRNVAGATNAIISAHMALAGIKSAIPADEVVETMGRIGRQIPSCLRETSKGGLAITPTALKISQQLKN